MVTITKRTAIENALGEDTDPEPNISSEEEDTKSSESDDIPPNYPPLLLAAERGDITALTELLNNGEDINQLDDDGYSALHLVLVANSLSNELYYRVINFLLEKQIDVNIQDPHGETALHYVVVTDEYSVIEELLKNGADIYIKNNENETPYDLAVKRNIAHLLDQATPRLRF